MFKKFISKMLVAGMLLGCLTSCSDNSGKIMHIGDVSVDSVDISVDGNAFVADSNSIDESLFNYLYMYFKEDVLSVFKQYEDQINAQSDVKISVADTKEFWSATYSKDEDGNTITFGDYLYDSTVSVFEDVLALEACAEKYGFKLPDSYDKELNELVAQWIVSTGSDYLQGTSEIADADGNIYDWVKDRWAMQLMSEGISTESWERAFFLKNIFAKNIISHLKENGVIKAEDDDALRAKGEKLLKEKLDAFMKNNVKVKYIAYTLKDEKEDETSKETKTSESGEASEDSSADVSFDDVSSEDVSEEVSSEDTSSDIDEDLSPKEYNEKLREKCKNIYDGLLDGSLDIDEEVKKSETSSMPNGIVDTFDSFEEYFGESAKELKVGDVRMYECHGALHIIQVQELKKEDSGISELSDADIENLRGTSLEESFYKIFDQFKDAIVYDEDMLEKYKSPWNIK